MRGNSFELYVQSPIHASGLRSHGMSPILSELYDQKQMRAISVEQTEVQSRTNIRPHRRHPLPPPRESSHAIKAVHQLQSTLSAHTRGAQILTPS